MIDEHITPPYEKTATDIIAVARARLPADRPARFKALAEPVHDTGSNVYYPFGKNPKPIEELALDT
ncbi:MAG: hypothetical protein LRZ85_01470 [Alphaproteobacteria bacterium]|nr:hypothetical protein [Alphaproteobacteria bacterium]MCD8571271.1 hypothetical protein [Alphaproteobacteria bacterium]